MGVTYGIFDIERILHTINNRKYGKRSNITVLKKGMDAIEGYRLARYLMHTQVYFHHTRAIADSMFRRSVEIAIRDKTLNNKILKFDNNNFLANYLLLDDSRLFQIISSNPQSNAYTLINDLENRILLKRGFEIDLMKDIKDALERRRILSMEPKKFTTLEASLADSCDCDKDFIIADLQKIENVLYRSSYEPSKNGKTPILIEDENGKVIELDEISPFSALQKPQYKFYIFCPEEYRPKVSELAEYIWHYL